MNYPRQNYQSEGPPRLFRGRGGHRRPGRGSNYRGRGRGGPQSYSQNSIVVRSEKDFVYIFEETKSLRYTNPQHVKVSKDESSLIVDNFSKSLKLLGNYSEDVDKNMSMDKSSLLFLKTKYMPDEDMNEKTVHFDLNEGVTGIRKYTGTHVQGFNNLLSWIVSNKDIFEKEFSTSRSSEQGGQFVMLKNVLSRIHCIPYTYGRPLVLEAISTNNVIFISRGEQLEQNTSLNDTFTNWGHNFEKFMTRENPDDGVDCNEDFRVVLSSLVDGHKVIYSGATDCVHPDIYDDELEDTSAFVGLKTTLDLEDSTPDFKIKFEKAKTLDYHSYALLLGIDKVIVGFRNNKGIVSRLRLFDKQELQEIGENHWHPVLCLTYVSKLLSFIKSNCEAFPGETLRFEKKSCSNEVSFTPIQNSVPMIPEWFFEELNEEDSED